MALTLAVATEGAADRTTTTTAAAMTRAMQNKHHQTSRIKIKGGDEVGRRTDECARIE